MSILSGTSIRELLLIFWIARLPHVSCSFTSLTQGRWISHLWAVLRIRDVYPGTRILIFIHLGSQISDPGSQISDLGSRIPDFRSRIPDLKSWILDPGSQIPDPGSQILDPGSQILDLGSRISDLGSRISDLGSRISDLGSRIPDPVSNNSNKRGGGKNVLSYLFL
jgi:hypothetical protein